jgi:hypothetical protein
VIALDESGEAASKVGKTSPLLDAADVAAGQGCSGRTGERANHGETLGRAGQQ